MSLFRSKSPIYISCRGSSESSRTVVAEEKRARSCCSSHDGEFSAQDVHARESRRTNVELGDNSPRKEI